MYDNCNGVVTLSEILNEKNCLGNNNDFAYDEHGDGKGGEHSEHYDDWDK